MLPTKWNNVYEKSSVSIHWNSVDHIEPHTFQSNCCFPAPRHNYLPYFEVFVTNISGTHSTVAIGIGTTDINGYHILPGWVPGSYGYHSNDGCVYPQYGAKGPPYSPRYVTGDVVGCGLTLENELYFTKNGKNLGVVCKLPRTSKICPLVGLVHAAISANFGNSPFMYNPFTNMPNLRPEDHNACLGAINETTVLHILSFLTHTQLTNFSATCKNYFRLSKCNQLWKLLLWRKWETVSHDVPITSYYEFFKSRTKMLQQSPNKKNNLIENCMEWEFECPATLDKLTRTLDPNVDHCSVCKKDVHLVHSMDQLKEKVAAKNCVAIDFDNQQIKARTRPVLRTMGMMVSRK